MGKHVCGGYRMEERAGWKDLGSASQLEGEHQALFCHEEFGGLVAHNGTPESKREKPGM